MLQVVPGVDEIITMSPENTNGWSTATARRVARQQHSRVNLRNMKRGNEMRRIAIVRPYFQENINPEMHQNISTPQCPCR